jgi:hypothetical protein
LTKIVSPVTDLGHIALLQWRSEPWQARISRDFERLVRMSTTGMAHAMKVATAEGSELE